MVGTMTWAPWVQEALDEIEQRRERSPAWQRAERQWNEITMLARKGIVVVRRQRPRQWAMEAVNAAA